MPRSPTLVSNPSGKSSTSLSSRATAIAYAREGAAVAINYLDAESPDAQSLADLIEGEGGTHDLIWSRSRPQAA